ncbi:hypothetical protein TSUD_391180 [Trifolium subterraneum]|uniref:Uncharacterized protein n=1 Tax=Trifolium subterraneum TaxID=3900 RepID=A0A2Z6MZ54_TRISU|nr:hypothetical protein TSUD_391180 [Trifolium subterraneum]
MFSRERSCDFSLIVSQPLLRLGFDGDLVLCSPGFLQVHPGYLSKFSWPLTPDRVSPLCPSAPPVRFLYHRLAHLCPSSPPLGYCALSLSKRQSLLTTPWVPNLRSNSATHHQDEKTSQLVVNLKPPTLPPPEPPPTGFCLNLFSNDELLVTDCVLCRPPPKPPWLYWAWFKLAWVVFVDMPQQRFVFMEKKSLAVPLGVVDTNSCNHFLFQFSSNQLVNFDIIETTYSRNELAAVANLIRNWIEKKTLDSLLFIVIDRGRKTLQPWKL